MSTLLKEDAAAAPASTRQQPVGIMRSTLKLLVQVVPSLIGAGLLGALKGVVIFGLLGLGVSAGYLLLPRLLGSPPRPIWLDTLGGVLPPLALSLAGGYVLMLQGVMKRLAREMKERGLVGYLYALIKPTVVQVAHHLRGAGPLSRAEHRRAIKRALADRLRAAATASDQEPASRTERLERFLMQYSRRILGLVALRTALSAPDAPTAVRNLETLGLDRLESALEETLEDLFTLHMVLALGAGLLVTAVPPLLLVLLR
jgi:hypothetical protein